MKSSSSTRNPPAPAVTAITNDFRDIFCPLSSIFASASGKSAEHKNKVQIHLVARNINI